MGTRSRKKNGTWGSYTWQSYSQVAERRTAIGSGLCALGVAPDAHVGLFGVNSADWMLVDLALHAYGFVAVPLYDTLGPEVVQFICEHAELSVVAVAAPLLAGLIKVLPECHTVKAIVRPYSHLRANVSLCVTYSSEVDFTVVYHQYITMFCRGCAISRPRTCACCQLEKLPALHVAS